MNISLTDFFLTDIKGPIMTSNKVFPLISGFEVEMICNVSVSEVQVQIYWDCGNSSNTQHIYRTTTEYFSTFRFIPTPVLSGTNCICLVEVYDIVSTVNITLEVTSKKKYTIRQFSILTSIVHRLHKNRSD